MSRLLQKEGNNKNEEDSRKIRLFRPKNPILEKSASQNSPNKTSGEYLLPQIILSPRERNLQQINRDLGTTILFVEQNLSVIQGLAERCYAMDHGRMVDELDGEALHNREQLEEYLVV